MLTAGTSLHALYHHVPFNGSRHLHKQVHHTDGTRDIIA